MAEHEQDDQDIDASEDEGEESAEQVGFWRRMFGGGGKGEAEDDEAEDDEAGHEVAEAEVAEIAVARNQPRKPSRKTIFDKAEAEQRKRYARAAMVRREKMARSIGDRVEKVILERMENGDQKLESVAGSFGEVRTLLGAIGRNLDDQGGRTERIADVLQQLPAASEKEAKILGQIARTLEGQSGSSRDVAESLQDMPQMLALAEQGHHAAHQRLEAIREVKSELALQREQRQHLLAAFRESTNQFEERFGRLEEAMITGAAQARNDAESLRRALGDTTRRLVEQSEEEARREDDRTGKIRSGLHELSGQLREQNQLQGAAVRNQGEAMNFFQDSHGEMLDALQRTQNRTLKEMKRIQEEVQERADSLAWRGRLTLVGAAGAIALTLAFMFRAGPATTVTVPQTPTESAAATQRIEATEPMPASFKRDVPCDEEETPQGE